MRSSYNEASRLPGSSPVPPRDRRVSQSLDFSRLEVSIPQPGTTNAQPMHNHTSAYQHTWTLAYRLQHMKSAQPCFAAFRIAGALDYAVCHDLLTCEFEAATG